MPSLATTKVWTNGASTGLWNTAGNWAPSGVPTSSDSVKFDATSSANCSVNVSPSVQALIILSSYTGVVNMGNQTLTLSHACTIQSTGTFNAGTSTIDIVSAVGLFPMSSAQALYNLTITSGNTFQYNASVSSNLIVQNDFVLTQINFMGSGFFGTRRISVFGNATCNDADGWNSTGSVMMAGSANQQVYGNGIFTQFIVYKSSGIVSLASFTGSFGLVNGGYCRLETGNSGTLNLGGITVDGYVFQIQSGTFLGNGTVNGAMTCSGSGVLSPGGNSPGCITINGDFTMLSGSTLRVDIQGTVSCSQYDQLVVNGTVTLNNPTITGGSTFQTTAPVTIIDNDDNDAVSGTFNGLADGSNVTLSGKNYTVNYNASGDNDVVLTTVNLPPVAECNWIERGITSECNPYYINETIANNGSYDPEGGPITLSISTNGPFNETLGGFFMVDLTVTDTLGASSVCTAFVIVYDTVAATITTPCPNTIVVCGSQSVSWTEPEAIDAGNCSVTRYRSSSATNGAEAPGDVFPVGDNEILYQWDGGGSPTAYCTMHIIVLPLPDLSIAQSQLSGACQGAKLLTANVANTSSLSAPLLYTWSGTVSANTPTVQATQNGTYTVTVTDAADCFSTATVTLVVDAIDPVPTIAALSDITAQCGVTITNFPTANDNCAGTITGTTSDPLTYAAQGTYTITWTYDDGNGNVVTQDQDVIIQDNTAPVPDVQTLSAVTEQCTATITAPTATDNCTGVITGTTSDPVSYTTQGNYTITWTYDDGNGNTTIQTQTVVVNDNTAPVPDVTTLQTINGQCSATVSSVPTATDNCTGGITGTTSDPLFYTTQGNYTVTWTYDDGNGNTTTQTQTVVVNDNTAPIPDVSSLQTVTGQCSATVTVPTATDNCAGTITGTTSSPLTYTAQGNYTITWMYDDGNGNTATQTQTVVVNDNTAPVPNITSLQTITGQCSATVTAPTATDNCAGVITGTTSSPLTYTTQGTRTITWTYNDGNGNVTTQTQTVIVNDNTAPVPNVTSLQTITGQCSATVTAPTATDNCAGTITGTTSSPLTYTTQGTRTITWTYNDGNGNVTTQSQTVIVNDNTPPVPNVSSLATINAQCLVTVTTRPTATDNCNGTITATTTSPLTYTTQGTHTITWRYTDASGNVTTQTQSVVILDNTPPTPNVSNLQTITKNCSAYVGSRPYATDNCGGCNNTGTSVRGTTTSPTSFSNAGTYTIVWVYTDASGNSTTQNQTVIVVDNTAPVPSVTTLPTIYKQCNHTVGYPYPSATDNCRGSIAGSPSQTTFTTQGTHTLVWTYNDRNGNVTTQNQTIVIQDTTRPTISCRGTSNSSAHSVGLNSNGTLTLTNSMASSFIHYASDNCGGAPTLSITSGQTTFGCSNVGQLFTIGITATDASGNSVTCNSIIRIVPGTGNDDDCDGVHNACDQCPGGNDAVDNDNDGYPDCKYPPTYANVKTSWKCGTNKVWVWYRNNANRTPTCIQYSALQNLISTNQVWLGGASYCCTAKLAHGEDQDIPYGIWNSDETERIIVSPNPASQNINLVLVGMDNMQKNVRITDLLGNTIYTTSMGSGSSELDIDLTTMTISNGVYMLHIETPTDRLSTQFVVVR